MKHYNRIKNMVIALLIGFVYYKYIVPNVPVLNKLFAIAFVCAFALAVLERLDEAKKARIRAKREKTKSA